MPERIRQKKQGRKTRRAPKTKPVAGKSHGPVPSPADAQPAEPLTLHDAAALFVQSAPDDRSGMECVRDALLTMSMQSSTPALVQQLLGEAVSDLQAVILNNSTDHTERISAIGQLIENALDVWDDQAESPATTTEPSADATEPVCSDSRPVSVEEEVSTTVAVHTEPGPDSLPPDADVELLADFITEGRECIDGAEAALLALETDPDDQESVNTVFRAFHTIKGTSAFMNLTSITELAHHAESLLGRVRDHEVRFTGGYADLALRAIDMLKALFTVLQDALGGQPMTPPDGYADLFADLANPEDAGTSSESVDEPLPAPRVGDILVSQGKATRSDIEAVAADQGKAPIGVAIVKSNVASVTDVAKALRIQK